MEDRTVTQWWEEGEDDVEVVEVVVVVGTPDPVVPAAPKIPEIPFAPAKLVDMTPLLSATFKCVSLLLLEVRYL